MVEQRQFTKCQKIILKIDFLFGTQLLSTDTKSKQPTGKHAPKSAENPKGFETGGIVLLYKLFFGHLVS